MSPLSSMTGFASVRGKAGGRRFLLEAKSVNHRFCEVNVRLPGRYALWEFEIQKEVRQRFHRGRIDIFVKEEGEGGASDREVATLKKAHRQLKRLARELNLPREISFETLIQFSQLYYREDEGLDVTALWREFRTLNRRLLDRLAAMRCREGRQLLHWFQAHLPPMERLVVQIERAAKRMPQRFQARFEQRCRELGLDRELDRERIFSEALLLTEKSDVTEELVRLRSHLVELRRTLKTSGSVGRKIDFLMQEVGREANTISAKSQDTQISQWMIQFKGEIEKVREQAANVE